MTCRDGGVTAGAALNAAVTIGGVVQPTTRVGPYCDAKTIPAGAWTHCRIPLAVLGAANATVDGIILQEATGLSLPTLFVDTIQLSTTTTTTPSYVYRDALVSPWLDWSWASHTLSNTNPVAAGSDSIAVTFAPWTALYFSHSGYSIVGRSTLSMRVHGGVTAGAAIVVKALVNGSWTAGTALGLLVRAARFPPAPSRLATFRSRRLRPRVPPSPASCCRRAQVRACRSCTLTRSGSTRRPPPSR